MAGLAILMIDRSTNPLQRFLVGQRIFWRTPAITDEPSNLYMIAMIKGCTCRFIGTPLASLRYGIKLESEVWSEMEWFVSEVDLFRSLPDDGSIWTRAKALKPRAKKRTKKKTKRGRRK